MHGRGGYKKSLRIQLIAGLPRGTRGWLLPLLPSGPDGVHNLPLRGTQLSVLSAMGVRELAATSAAGNCNYGKAKSSCCKAWRMLTDEAYIVVRRSKEA